MKSMVFVVWNAYTHIMNKVRKKVDFMEMEIFSNKSINSDPEVINRVLSSMKSSDAVFLFRSSDDFWDVLDAEIKGLDKPVVSVGHDPAHWSLSTLPLDVPAKAYEYIIYGGEENFENLFRFLGNRVLGLNISYEHPKALPWEGIYHPRAETHFSSIEEFLSWYRPKKGAHTVGILYSRHYYVNGNMEVEEKLIDALERRGFNVIPVFSYSLKDEGLGAKGSKDAAQRFFFKDGRPLIDALVKLQTFFLGTAKDKGPTDTESATSGVELFKEMDVPVFQPVVSFHKTVEEWKEDPQGLGLDVSWSVAMPEFEGVIEPIFIGGGQKVGDDEVRKAVVERVDRLADRIGRWIRLRAKKPEERKVVFILHNNPCASVEASVGGGAHLDTLESVARVMKRMKEQGYKVNPPKDGKELINDIMGRKAISEFRWTTVDEIVKKGGALALISLDTYMKWWKELPEKVREKVSSSWGEPPGEEVDGVPPAMVYEGKIVVTGVRYGNVVVAVQPKRGCAGSRCDGKVCKILHDPSVPPPHQYIATYRYFEDIFGADCVVHVGTHGNLEFLPGKGTGLSNECFPDIAIGRVPHLYIYNADNPPEGTIAKRRSYAVLVDHMQTTLVGSGLYEGYEELERYLEEYEKAKVEDKARAHTLEHLIVEKVKELNLSAEVNLDGEFSEVVRDIHGVLSSIRNSQVQDGLHILGDIPRGERLVEFIFSIMRFDTGEDSIRWKVASSIGLDVEKLVEDKKGFDRERGVSYGKLLEMVDQKCKEFIRRVLKGEPVPPEFSALRDRVLDIKERVERSDEIGALLHGISGGYIPPGPSGLITRGRDDILPTGRNFYTLDPERVPTKAAYRVGVRLADALIERFLKEEGRYPENVAIYWMCNDIMWSDGEGMAKIMALIGVRPKWLPNGRVSGFEIIPLSELKRPRIDVTIRVSGITRDNFPGCIALLDEAIYKVALLDEPVEHNFVRKHTLERLKENGGRLREATFRIFASKPGTYMAGVNLAVYASAWKDERDLADVFVYWNSYAYGKDVFGKEAPEELVRSLKSVDVTFNKVVTDEYDLFGCCCYFGTHGGITVAARSFSGKKVKTYYGDTRDPSRVEVRTLADEVRRVVRTKLLNPKWIEGMKRHGYKGAGDISKRVGRVFGWQATTKEVDGWVFDDIAKTFVLNEENRKFFEENNPWALEEIGRRLIEAAERGLWNPDEDLLEELKEVYFSEIEGWLEEGMEDVRGEFQGGGIDIITSEDVERWGKAIDELRKKIKL